MKRQIQNILLISFFLLGANTLKAQVWNTVGGGISNYLYGSKPNLNFHHQGRVQHSSINNELYVLYPVEGSGFAKMSKWNGAHWTHSAEVVSKMTVTDAKFYGGKLFVSKMVFKILINSCLV